MSTRKRLPAINVFFLNFHTALFSEENVSILRRKANPPAVVCSLVAGVRQITSTAEARPGTETSTGHAHKCGRRIHHQDTTCSALLNPKINGEMATRQHECLRSQMQVIDVLIFLAVM